MLRRRLNVCLFGATAVLATALAAPAPLHAQNQNNAAGVIVDADGVLRTRVVTDRFGELMKRRVTEAKAALDRDLARPSKIRYVSLTRLEAAIAEKLARGEGLTDEMKSLAGLTRIQYVFFYPETGDIVIAGPAEGFTPDLTGRIVGITSGRATLQLEDMIVALRAFPPGGQKTDVVGCSIDPTKEGLKRMQDFLVAISGRVAPSDAERIALGLRENLGLQTVTINGVSPNTHFAQVLVEADYRMKLIGIGLETPPVKITSYVSKARPRDVARNAMQRWYFTPDYECVRVSEDKLAMELVGQGVKLIGADELVRADGTRVAAADSDAAGNAFTKSFTARYEALADKSPVYAQLRNLIDMAVAAAFIQQQDYYGQADWRMEVFSSEDALAVETYEAPKQVETAVNAIWKGNTLMTPVGGGVNIQPRLALSSDNLLSDDKGEVKSLREQTGIGELAKDRWWWD